MFQIETEQIFSSKFATARKMIDSLIALDSLDKFLGDICVHPEKENIIKMIFLIVKFIIEVLVNKVMDDGILCFEHDDYIGNFMNFSLK